MDNKPYKSKVKVIEENVSEVWLTWNATPFTKLLLKIADYIQVKYNNEVGEAVRTQTKKLLTTPQCPSEKNQLMHMEVKKLNNMEVFLWKENWKESKDFEKEFINYQKTAYPVVVRPCSPALRAQLEGTKGYEIVNSNQDVVEMLKLIKNMCWHHDQNNDETYAVVSSLKAVFYFCQKLNTTNTEYLKEFKAQVESMDDYMACLLGKFLCLI